MCLVCANFKKDLDAYPGAANWFLYSVESILDLPEGITMATLFIMSPNIQTNNLRNYLENVGYNILFLLREENTNNFFIFMKYKRQRG